MITSVEEFSEKIQEEGLRNFLIICIGILSPVFEPKVLYNIFYAFYPKIKKWYEAIQNEKKTKVLFLCLANFRYAYIYAPEEETLDENSFLEVALQNKEHFYDILSHKEISVEDIEKQEGSFHSILVSDLILLWLSNSLQKQKENKN